MYKSTFQSGEYYTLQTVLDLETTVLNVDNVIKISR